MARFQLEISEEGIEEIETLMEETGTPTKREFVNNALSLLKWAIRQRERGYSIAAVNEAEGVYRELEMPILDHAALKARRSSAVLGTDQQVENQGGTRTMGG